MKGLKFGAALLAASCILIFPQPAVDGARSAMAQWAYSVAPALFPFLALMPSLTGPQACAAYEAAFGRWMRPLLGLPGSAAPAVIIGMIAGSPGGAIALSRIAAQTGMPAGQSHRIALAVCGVSPAYLILGVGQGLLGSARLGVRLAAAQLFTQILLLILLRPACRDLRGNVPPPPGERNEGAIRPAVETVLAVCGYMVLFSALASVAAGLLGRIPGTLLLLAADLPSGLAALAQTEIPGGNLLLGAGIGFAGLCIAAQNLDALKTIGVKPGMYLSSRAMAALVMSALCGLILPGKAVTGAGVPRGKTAYALSLLAAAMALIPVLNSFSRSEFLNKRKLPRPAPENR